MPFETFKRQRFRPDSGPLVTIQSKGTFSLNHSAWEALGQPKAVELLYDRESSLIGIRKVSPSEDHAYLLRQTGRGSTWLFSGRAFAQYYGIKLGESRRWRAELDGRMLVVDLKTSGALAPSNRTRAKAGAAA